MLQVSVLKDHHQALKYMHSYLCFKSCILMSDDGPLGPQYVAFMNDIIKSMLCPKVTYKPIPIQYLYVTAQRDGLH